MPGKKIFISHRGSEQHIADEVIAALTAIGHEAIDMSDWKNGESFIEKMEDAFDEGDAMIALVTPAYLQSDMCKLELRTALHIRTEDQSDFLAIYRIGEPKLSRLYSTLINGDFTAGIDAGALHKRFPNEAPSPSIGIHNLPPVPGSVFFGRNQYQAELDRVILNANAASIRSVKGMGGVGKTTLALHYAHSEPVAKRFPIRWWVLAETKERMHADLAALARKLKLADDQTADLAAATAARDWLRAAPREALILYDNAEDGALLKDWLPGENAALVTTRQSGMAALPSTQEISLDVWREDTARDFLMERTGDEDAEAALKLAQALEGLPLACEQAAAYCREAEETLGEYLEAFEASPAELMDESAAGDTNANTVAKTFELAIARAAEDCAAAPTLLSIMAELAPAPLPEAVFGHEKAPDGLQGKTEFRRARSALTRWALVRRVKVQDPLQPVKTPCLDTHRLIRHAAKDMETTTALSPLERATKALGGAFPDDTRPATETQSWPLCAALAPHAAHLTTHITKTNWSPTEDPNNATLALNQAALFLKNARADYQQARSMYEAALKIDETTHGPDHPDVAITLSNLANVLLDLGGPENLSQAKTNLERALKIDETTHGPDHPNVAAHLSNLAPVLRTLGGPENLSQAKTNLERALKIDETTHGPDHPSVAIRLSNLAEVLRTLGGPENLTQAKTNLERALKIDETTHGPDHPNVATRLNNLTYVLLAQNNTTDAVPHARRALQIRLSKLGKDHPYTQGSAALLARLEGNA